MIWLVAASLIWAFAFGLIKRHLPGLDPWLVGAVRLSLAALVFLPWTIARAPRSAVLRRRAVWLGMLQFGAMYVFYVAAFASLAAWQVALWTVLTPIYVALLGAGRSRRGAKRPLAAAGLAVAGALLAEGRLPAGQSLQGVLLVQASNLCFAAGQLGYRPLAAAVRAGGSGRGAEAGLLGWMYLGGAALTLAGLALKSGGSSAAISGEALAVLIYLGTVSTGVGFWLWNKGAARTGTGLLAVANNLKVPLAVIVSWLVFREGAPYARALAGLLVMLAAWRLAGAGDRAGATDGDERGPRS